MKRPQLWKVVLSLSIVLNLALLAGVAGMAASGSVADRIAPRLHLASEQQATKAQSTAKAALTQLGAANFGTVADELDSLSGEVDDLDGRVSDVENQLDTFAPGSLADDVDAVQTDVRDLSTRLDGACSAARSAASQQIGTDSFYSFLGLERALC